MLPLYSQDLERTDAKQKLRNFYIDMQKETYPITSAHPPIHFINDLAYSLTTNIYIYKIFLSLFT